jgi:alpha-amylase
MKKFFILILLLCLAACTFNHTGATPTQTSTLTQTVIPTDTTMPTSTPEAVDLDWWSEAVFYEIYVRSFYDSDGDGIGDLNGLIEKLDYLNDGDPGTNEDLGVTALWLMPIFPSPSEHSYDVTDFYDVKAEYGSLEDFRRLVEEVHTRGMRLIIDLPLNHTSSEHPWFIQSQDPASPYRDWYTWEDTDPGFTGPWNRQVWHEMNGDYFYGYFWEGMPDLNYTNPEVTAEMQNVTRFWLEDIGIDGFRLDAIGALIEVGTETVETQASHDWFKDYFAFYKSLKPEAMTVGEIWVPDAVVVPWVINQEVDLAFEFDLSFAMIESLNQENAGRMLDTLKTGTSLFPEGKYGTFLSNHDMARVMTQIGGDPQKAKAGASLYFSLPGVPFIYYGEEIGLFGEIAGGGGRLPMQWNGLKNAGFSTGTPWLPVGEQFTTYNVEAETDDPDSLLSHYRRLIELRTTHPALRNGTLLLPDTTHPNLFAALRISSGEVVMAFVNLGGRTIRGGGVSLVGSPLEEGKYLATSLLDGTSLKELTVYSEGRISSYVPLAEIPPYGTVVILLER